MGRKSKIELKGSKKGFQIGDIWNNNGKVWYSGTLIKRVINLCEKAKEAYNSNIPDTLAGDILSLLDYKGSKGE